MTLHTLSSGSQGNCLLLSDGDTHILVDAGISTRRIKAGLAQLELSMDELDGILITHEHTDHISGLATLIKHHSIPLYASPLGFACMVMIIRFASVAGVEPLLRPREPGCQFEVGQCLVTAFETSHDAAQSMDYRIDGSGSVGILTDTGYVTDEAGTGRSGGIPRRGYVTDEAAQVLPGVSLLVLESNHDVEYLRSGPYPYTLKQRILGSQGHLSNDDAAAFAAQMAAGGTRCIVLAHLSRENNTPQRAYDTVRRALDACGASVELLVAPRDELSPAYETENALCRR